MSDTDLNIWFLQSLPTINQMAKMVLMDRFREGVSEIYIYFHKTKKRPDDIKKFSYWFFKNIGLKTGTLNYRHTKLEYLDELDCEFGDIDERVEMEIDLCGDSILIDFLLNNKNNEMWIEIYKIVYGRQIQLDLFESILFDYVFNMGLSIREISSITGTSQSFIYKWRKQLIDKIKDKINEKK